MDHGGAMGHHPAFRVYDRPVERVEHGPDQLPHRPGVNPGIPVQSDDIAQVPQGVRLPGDGQGGRLPAEQAGQLREGPPLPLVAGPALPVKSPSALKEVEAAAVFPV